GFKVRGTVAGGLSTGHAHQAARSCPNGTNCTPTEAPQWHLGEAQVELISIGAVEKTRTYTPFPALPPQGSASTNSATTASRVNESAHIAKLRRQNKRSGRPKIPRPTAAAAANRPWRWPAC